MTFQKMTSDIFFSADLSKENETIINFYKNSKNVYLDSPKLGYTIYPPLSALGGEEQTQRLVFHFDINPNVKFKFERGEILLRLKKNTDNKSIGSPIMKFIFKDNKDLDSAYLYLTNLYAGLSTKKRITATISEFSSDNLSSVNALMISTGQGDSISNGPVMLLGLGNDLH